MTALGNIQPADVLAIRSQGVGGRLIRFGAALRELVTNQSQPNLHNHIAVVHHIDKHGTLWGIEGRPGGVGWVDCDKYLRSPWTITNARQPKTDTQRHHVCDVMVAMLGTPYDWEAIEADTVEAFGLHWKPDWHGTVPGHVCCSSAAAYGYTKGGLVRPDPKEDGREVTPADWTNFILVNRYN